MFVKEIKKFPDDFIFSASTSAFQFEGGWTQDGRGESIYDHINRPEGITDFEVASDHYNRFIEDVKLLKDLKLDAYRFSVSWTRILPDGETVNLLGIKFYERLIDLLIESDIEPILTIYHFDYPQALIDKYGGWLSRKSINDYMKLVEVLLENFGDKVNYWITINEQDHVLKFRERLGISKKDQDRETERGIHQANYHMCVATAKAIQMIKRHNPSAKVGPAINPMPAYPHSSNSDDVLSSRIYEELSHYYILDMHCRGSFSPVYKKYLEDRQLTPDIRQEDLKLMSENPPNYLGINYYMNQIVEHSDKKSIDLRGEGVFVSEEAGLYKLVDNQKDQTEWGWNISPQGLFISLLDIYNRYQLPMLITENGLGAHDVLINGKIHDDYRIEYLREHLKQVRKAISLGIPVLGYSPWSAIDLVSGREGMDKRYGFVYVNRDNNDLKDLKRIKKDSYYWYKKIIESRGETL